MVTPLNPNRMEPPLVLGYASHYDAEEVSASNVFLNLLAEVMECGTIQTVRGSTTKEVLNVRVTIKNPAERCYIIPQRNDNIFHKIFEALWVISGRNDAKALATYLPRAMEWSDDGNVWRAGYGARLRFYGNNPSCVGVDQLAEIVSLLKADPATRRAVMTIYDPTQDFCNSKDIPCNNWIHWLIRPYNGKQALYMNVAQRSSDLIWGFSGINTFEWSLLHMMMCRWLGVEQGPLTYFISSLHIYEKMWVRAQKMLDAVEFVPTSVYDFGVNSAGDELTPFTVEFERLDVELTRFWKDEERLRYCKGFDRPPTTTDPFLLNCLEMLRVFHNINEPSKVLERLLNELPNNDFKLAAVEYVSRIHKDIADRVLMDSMLKGPYELVMKKNV